MANTETEERILMAAMDVLSQKTISGTRMHLIAEEAGMAQSNVHYHFKTKNDLMMALLEFVLNRFRQDRQSLISGEKKTLKEKLDGFFRQKQSSIQDNRKFDFCEFDFWTQGCVDPDIHAYFQNSYTQWRADMITVIDQYMPELPATQKNMVSYVMLSMMMGASLQYFVQDDPFDLEEYFATCLRMVLRELV